MKKAILMAAATFLFGFATLPISANGSDVTETMQTVCYTNEDGKRVCKRKSSRVILSGDCFYHIKLKEHICCGGGKCWIQEEK